MKRHPSRLTLRCTPVALATLPLVNCTASAKDTVTFNTNGRDLTIADKTVEAGKLLAKRESYLVKSLMLISGSNQQHEYPLL